MSTDIAVGPALDVGVAIKCGVKGRIIPLLMSDGTTKPHFGIEQEIEGSIATRFVRWSPSTDLNHAFMAAEKALRKEYGADWWQWFEFGLAVSTTDPNDVCWRADFRGTSNMCFGTTPAEAICRAILAMDGAK